MLGQRPEKSYNNKWTHLGTDAVCSTKRYFFKESSAARRRDASAATQGVQQQYLLRKRPTNEIYGTSFKSRIDDPKYQFAGKTGTAQVKRISKRERELDLKIDQIPYNDRDHALYIAYGPYKNPRYAVSIIVEHGGSGSVTAAPIAKKLFKFIIDRHELREQTRKQNLVTT